MSLKEIINKILYTASNRARTEGNLLFKKGSASNIKGKKIENIYHIYGKVSEKNNDYNSHIKVNIVNGEIVGASCTCEESSENSRLIGSYLCKHNLATTYMFYDLAKRKVSAKSKDKEKKDVREPFKKELLKLDIKIKQVKIKKYEFYEWEFRVGKNNTYLINSLEEFISKRESLIPYAVTNQYTYFPKRSIFSKEDEAVLAFVSEYIKLNKSRRVERYKMVDGKVIRLLPEDIKKLFTLIDKNKKITFNYDYMEYSSQVVKEDLPLGFTLKLLKNKFVLRTKINFPIPLNKFNEAYLYDRKIYLPSEMQIKHYIPLYNELKINGEMIFEKDADTILKLVTELSRITSEVIIDEGAHTYINTILTPQFYFDKKDGKLYCRVTINYGDKIVDIIKDTSSNFLRDFKREDKIDRELERLNFIKKDEVFTFIGGDEEIFNLLRFGFSNLKRIGDINLSEELKEINIINASLINAKVENIGEEFYLNYNTEILDIRELQSALNALNNNKRFYKTKKNDFLDLSDNETITFLNMIDFLQFEDDGRIKIDKNKAIFIEENIHSIRSEFTRNDKGLQDIKDKIKNRNCSELKQPKELQAILRDYQLIGLNWLNNISSLGFGGILADEMGLGKTIQTIAFLLTQKKSKSIIITPTSLIYNWKDEFEKFAPSLSIGIIHGSMSNQNKVLENIDKYDVIVTTYGTLKNNIKVYEDKRFNYCIIDEAQNIKNPKAQVTRVVKRIKGDCKIALTGTPMENNLSELWSIFDFIMPGFLFDETKFKERFIQNGDKGLEELKQLISPFVLRRKKQDVLLELPDKFEKKILVEMTPSQKQLYKSYIKGIKMKLKKDKSNRIEIFSYLTKLRQLCLDPSLLSEEYLGGSGKLREAIKITENRIELGNKILLFSQFTSALRKIGEELSGKDIGYLYLDGSTVAKERNNLVKKFNEEDDIKVFLISLKAGGTGLNLTSANIVIHFDPWWNPAIEDQATDRAHRIGQKNVVEVVKLISQGTIEEKIVKLQEEKKELINRVMNGEGMDGKNISILTNEEILDLFS